MIAAFNDAPPSVFALMDYWTFDGWFKLNERLKEAGSPGLAKTVFPGIELRLAAPMKGRLNAHVVFSDAISDQNLRDFKSKLNLELVDLPLSDDALRAYARAANADKLKTHGFAKEEILANDELALLAGCQIAELSVQSYKDAIAAVPSNLAVGFMPFDTNDGLEKIKWAEHYAFALGLFKASPIFETRKQANWAAFSGVQTEDNQEWFEAFQEALSGKKRLAVSGSDAHRFKGVPGDNNQRGYGDFPSGKVTWIKADPTWNGLLQAIREPDKRSFLGQVPDKKRSIEQAKTFYIDRVTVQKIEGAKESSPWLSDVDVPLNPDLVAIIGNKGSGKSALADIIALLGKSQQHEYFSFLRRGRFRGKSGEPASSFKGELYWLAGAPVFCILGDNPDSSSVELVRYIPQNRFEKLCNDHVTGQSNAFENELRAVIFSHLDPSVTSGLHDFDELIEEQEQVFRQKLGEKRKALSIINADIQRFEQQLAPVVIRRLKELTSLKERELVEHDRQKPKLPPEPGEALTPGQKEVRRELAELQTEGAEIEGENEKISVLLSKLADKRVALSRLRESISLLVSQFADFQNRTTEDHKTVALLQKSVAVLMVDESKLDAREASIAKCEEKIRARRNAILDRFDVITKKRGECSESLNKPQQEFHAAQRRLELWEKKRRDIVGSPTVSDSLEGLKDRQRNIEKLPEDIAELERSRVDVAGQIYELLEQQRAERAELFQPLQAAIESNDLIREDYRLQFEANLEVSAPKFASRLFELVKKSIGELRGDEEAQEAIFKRFAAHELDTKDGFVSFCSSVVSLLRESAEQSSSETSGIDSILRKDRRASEVYDLLFSAAWLEPKYSIRFQDTKIEQLSPGQRGALLLIFYLLVDTGRNPIILDQPEENLDNETIVSLLVPVLNLAKRTRQIIMVTHNPNLAVVCDAEQIIHAKFKRKPEPEIWYRSGSIESRGINKLVVDVLEGTKRAFDNRGGKYLDESGSDDRP